MQRLSLQQGTVQATTGNGDAITRLLEQQTQLIRNLADTSGNPSQESRVKFPEVKLQAFDGIDP